MWWLGILAVSGLSLSPYFILLMWLVCYAHVSPCTGGEDEGVSEGETEGAKEAWEGTGRHNRRGRGD